MQCLQGNVPGRGIAFPPRRIVGVAQTLKARGAEAVIGSICTDDYTAPIDRITRAIGTAAGGTCR